jgi:hypothetical protein
MKITTGYLLAITSTTVRKLIHSQTHWVPEALSPVVKRRECEADPLRPCFDLIPQFSVNVTHQVLVCFLSEI